MLHALAAAFTCVSCVQPDMAWRGRLHQPHWRCPYPAKPCVAPFLPSVQENWRIADFFSHHPESMHMVGALPLPAVACGFLPLLACVPPLLFCAPSRVWLAASCPTLSRLAGHQPGLADAGFLWPGVCWLCRTRSARLAQRWQEAHCEDAEPPTPAEGKPVCSGPP